jgi:hypothetical protein
MAKRPQDRPGQDGSGKPRRTAVRRRDAAPDFDGAPGYTTEEQRGRSFFEKLRMWQTFHRDGGRTIFTKTTLARAFFGEELDDALRVADDGPSSAHRGGDTRTKVLDRYRKSVQRTVEALQKMGVPILDVDKNGLPIEDTEELGAGASGRSERRWKYDATSHRAEELARLDRPTGLPAYEIVGMLACEELIRDLGHTQAAKGVMNIAARIRKQVPRDLYEQAREQARTWRYGLGDPGRYQGKGALLADWNRATLERHQVRILYETPGKPPSPRTLAALGTRFDREEDAVYLIGAEPDRDEPTDWRRPVPWKLDRIHRLEPLPLRPNPEPSAYPGHRLLGHTQATGTAMSRLDVERLFADSVGGFYSYDAEPIRLELLVHDVRWIAWCREKPFHPKQKVLNEIEADGSPRLRLIVERCYEDEMVNRLLRLGDAFTVVEPARLVTRLLEKVRGIERRHTSRPN